MDRSQVSALKNISLNELINHGILEPADNFNPETQHGLCCSFCDSGHGANHTGAGELDENNMFYCYACNNADNGGHKLSTIDLFMRVRGISDFSEACKQMASEFSYTNFASDVANLKTKPKKKKDIELLNIIKEDIRRSQLYIEALPINQRRGLTLETLTHFRFGFLKDWTHPNQGLRGYQGKKYLPNRRIIAPTSETHYNAIMLDCDRTEQNKNFWKQHTVGIELFNEPALLSNSDIIVVVEGEFDAASIWQASNGNIAVVGAIGGNKNLLLEAIEKHSINGKKFLILFDNDTGGQDKAKRLLDALIKAGFSAVSKIFDSVMNDEDRKSFKEKIDANAILKLKGNEFLKTLTEKIISESRTDFEKVAKDIAQRDFTNTQPTQITNTTENFNGEIYMTGLLEDLDNGRRLAKFCSDRVKWLTDSERWIIWDNKGVWLRCSEKNSCLAPKVSRFADLMMRHAIQLIKEAEKFSQAYLEISTEKDGRVKTNATPEAKDAEKKMKKANEKKEKALAIARDFRKVKKVSCAITMMKGVEDILITAEDLDNHPNLINCLNYVVDLQDKKLYPHTETRLKLITQQCRAAYIPDAKSELVDSFFKAIQPDEMTCAGLLRWLGYCLTGEVSEEKFMVHTGDGGNGKGVLSATVLELLASYGVGLAPTALLKSNKPIDADKASTALNGIELARFAISEEMPADGELDTSLIKNLTGGDRINLRKLYSEYRTVKPTAKINISGNYTPKIENVHDGGLLRRMLNMPYLVKFGTPNNPADHNLKKKMFLPENLNALLRLLVDEAFNWYRDGLIISPQMAQETKRHLAQNDFIADFIDDNETYERGANFTVKAKEFIDALKREYPRECSRFKRNDLIKLIAETDGITYTTDRTRARVFRGIGKKGAPQQQSFDDFDGEPISPDDLQP